MSNLFVCVYLENVWFLQITDTISSLTLISVNMIEVTSYLFKSPITLIYKCPFNFVELGPVLGLQGGLPLHPQSVGQPARHWKVHIWSRRTSGKLGCFATTEKYFYLYTGIDLMVIFLLFGNFFNLDCRGGGSFYCQS